MQLISKFNKGIRVLLGVIGIFSKYAWAIPLKDKKPATIVISFHISISIGKLDDIVNEYKNTYHRKIKMKPVDVKFGNYFKDNVNSNCKDPRFQVFDHL